MTPMDFVWVFVGGALYGLLALAAGHVLDWFWDRRRRGALPDDETYAQELFRAFRDRWKDRD